jgi:hypothetical protein
MQAAALERSRVPALVLLRACVRTQGVTHLQTSNFGFAPLSHWEHGATGYGLRNSVSFQTPVEFTGEAIDLAITSGAHVVEDVRLISSFGAPGTHPTLNSLTRSCDVPPLIRDTCDVARAQRAVNTQKYYREAQALALDDALEQGKAILGKLNCQWDGVYAIIADAPNMGYPMYVWPRVSPRARPTSTHSCVVSRRHHRAKMQFAESRAMFDAASPIVTHNEGEEVRASMTVQFSYSKCAL